MADLKVIHSIFILVVADLNLQTMLKFIYPNMLSI